MFIFAKTFSVFFARPIMHSLRSGCSCPTRARLHRVRHLGPPSCAGSDPEVGVYAKRVRNLPRSKITFPVIAIPTVNVGRGNLALERTFNLHFAQTSVRLSARPMVITARLASFRRAGGPRRHHAIQLKGYPLQLMKLRWGNEAADGCIDLHFTQMDVRLLRQPSSSSSKKISSPACRTRLHYAVSGRQ